MVRNRKSEPVETRRISAGTKMNKHNRFPEIPAQYVIVPKIAIAVVLVTVELNIEQNDI